jgi:hypothetical protein
MLNSKPLDTQAIRNEGHSTAMTMRGIRVEWAVGITVWLGLMFISLIHDWCDFMMHSFHALIKASIKLQA